MRTFLESPCDLHPVTVNINFLIRTVPVKPGSVRTQYIYIPNRLYLRGETVKLTGHFLSINIQIQEARAGLEPAFVFTELINTRVLKAKYFLVNCW